MKYSVVNYNKVLENEIKRLEAEFYNSTSLLTTEYYTGEEIIDFVQYGTSKELNAIKSGFPALRLNEFESLFIKHPEKYCDKIDIATYQSLSLKKDDVLICRTNGNPKLVGKSAIVLEDYDYAFASYLFRIRPDRKKILPTTLVIYLNSSTGRNEIEKYLMVSNQANFSPAKFREILIPKLGEKIQKLIDKIVLFSFDKHKEANTLYSQAEQTLLSELDLLNWKPKRRLSFVKNYSDAQSSNRIDAEYFQPMYEDIINCSKAKVETFLIDEVFTFKRGDFIDTKYYTNERTKRAYIRIKELSNLSSINEAQVIYIDDGFLDGSQNTLKEFDIVTAIIGDTIGKSNLILKEYEGSYFSNNTGRFRLRPDFKSKFDPFYLETLFHSIFIQSQIQRAKAQTGQPKIADSEIKKILIPCIDLGKQKRISQNIQKALDSNKLSKKLLHIAKRGVEMAIEKDEKTAQEWINSELRKLNIK